MTSKRITKLQETAAGFGLRLGSFDDMQGRWYVLVNDDERHVATPHEMRLDGIEEWLDGQARA